MEKQVYVDHSATTYIKKEVLDEMVPYFTENFGNASSIYSIGRKSREAIDEARKRVTKAIGARYVEEIYFTAGGSEADNMIIKGIARANKNRGNHIITSKIEHLAVLNTCKMLEKEGFYITYLDVDKNGIINVNDVQKAIRDDTILISVMFANNEIGTIQPIAEIGKLARFKGIYFHTDAVQAIGNLHINVEDMFIDCLSLSAHKFYGPKGVGAAFIRQNVKFEPIIVGGHQEKSKRAGTENTPGIVGLGKAIQIATSNIDEYNKKLLTLRNSLIEKIQSNIEGVTVNGDIDKRLPGNINISIKDCDGQTLLLLLDMKGICASSGSACNSGSSAPSHVLTALGIDKKTANSSLRITLGEENTESDIEYIADELKYIVKKIRNKNK